jgi:hypothetical protein
MCLALGASNFRTLKDLKGWKPTIICSILSIIFIILAPKLDSWRGQVIFIYAMGIGEILLGLASILLFRVLAYLIRTIESQPALWVLIVSLSLCAGFLFVLLNILAYRFIFGEAMGGVITIAIGVSLIIMPLSFYFNLRAVGK